MKKFFWPDIDTLEDADKITKNGATAAFIITAVTGTLTFLETHHYFKLLNLTAASYIDAGLFLIIGLGILFHSRLAALAGLCLYLFEQFAMIQAGSKRINYVAIYFILVFIASVRASFAYHEFKKYESASEGPPNVPAAAVSEADAPPKRSPWRLLVTVLVLLGLGGAGLFFGLPYLTKPKKNSNFSLNLPAETNHPAISGLKNKPEASAPVTLGAHYKKFHMKSGETVSGDVTQEDPDYFIVKPLGGKEEVLARKDILSIE